jgi:UDPglucose--hexose-1-phosphate uridylyltransferase
VAYAAYRQGRTFLPPPEYNPLRPSTDAANPTELPAGDYDVAVFDNLFPSLSLGSHDPPASLVATAPAQGHCEVVVFTQNPEASLGSLPLDHIDLLLQVWGRRTQLIARNEHIRYVLPFENRGKEVGVTLHHPHGQIYAYSFVPPVPEQMHQNEAAYFAEHGRGLLQTLIEAEIDDGRRMIYCGEHSVAFVPAWARYPYEVWVAPRRAVPDFAGLNETQRRDLARALKTTLLKFDGLWQQPFPYIMAWYQAPLAPSRNTRDQSAAERGATPVNTTTSSESSRGAFHLHAEFYPPYRMPGRLKYLAGTEIAAGMFANDALPEEKARELQAVEVEVQGFS